MILPTSKCAQIRCSDLRIICIIGIIILRGNIFDLFSTNGFVIGGIRSRDLFFIVSVLWSLFILLKYKGFKYRTSFNVEIFSFFIIILISCFTAWFYFNQSLLLGFQAQRDIFAGFLFFLAVDTLINCNKISKEKLLDCIRKLGYVQLLVNTISWGIYASTGNLITKGARIFVERYGSPRIMFSNSDLIALLLAFAINDLLNKKSIVRGLLTVLWGLIYYTIFSKLRAATIALVLAAVVCIAFMRRAGVKKIILLLVMAIALLLAIDYIPTLQDIIVTLLKKQTLSANTMDIRSSARLYYISEFLKSPLVGWGFPHTDCMSAFSRQGTSMGFYFSDNGIFSFVYIYGLVGIFWFVALVKRIVKMLKYNIKVNDYIGMFYFAYQLVMLGTGMFWIIGSSQLEFSIGLLAISTYRQQRD